MMAEQQQLKNTIEARLGKKIRAISLLGQGMCNNTWQIITENNDKYVIKQARLDQEENEQNDLLLEAKIIQRLNQKNPSLPVPRLLFITENPTMYAYHYISGNLMQEAWQHLSAAEKNSLCKDLAKFHYELGQTLSLEEAHDLGIFVNAASALEAETEADVKTFLMDVNIPKKYKAIVEAMYETYYSTQDQAFLTLCHNDAHPGNIIIHQGKLSGIIDFGDAEYGDIHIEFTRYAQDYPAHFDLIIKSYESLANITLSKKRIIAQAILEGIDDIRTEYLAQKRIAVLENYFNLFKISAPLS
ncbi:MAG: aminoglycoside phosphotransferase family protein [Saprospiraceae bacterium]